MIVQFSEVPEGCGCVLSSEVPSWTVVGWKRIFVYTKPPLRSDSMICLARIMILDNKQFDLKSSLRARKSATSRCVQREVEVIQLKKCNISC